ncbi:RNA-directed DNA polymerase, eukaryota [Tanacetum coccineum]
MESRPSANGASSFVSVLKGNPNTINHISASPAMVLDDECLVERDLDNFVLGEVKDFSSINNLLILLSNEGFQHVRLVYLGGLWVMIELPSIETKTRFMKHVGVASWFSQLRTAQSDFVSRERIVWIDIEGVPLHAWSRPTFSKIGSRWGEVLELEDNKDDCFAPKELFVWSPSFKGVNDAEFVSDDDSVNGEEEKNDDMSKKDKGEENTGLDSSLPFPPGFTPADQVKSDIKNSPLYSHSGGLNSRVLEESQPTKDQGSPKDNLNQRVGGYYIGGYSDMIKAKIQWAIEGDENSKFFHGIINRKRANLAIKGVMVDGDWVDDPCRVKEEFRLHFANRFRAPVDTRYKLNYTFPNKLQPDQMATLESPVSRDEVRNAVWGCGENKSSGPDGFSFEFFRKFWDTVGSDFYEAVEWFFEHSSFSRGCNSSFIALIPKNQDPKFGCY